VYVVVNVDETSVNTLLQSKHGYVLRGLRRRSVAHRHQAPHRDRTDIKTTLMGVVCDQPHLQPYLPQVFMPKYTQNRRPPVWARERFARQGFPFQYWHGTSGGSTPGTFRLWATSLRSAVHSFDPSVWILLIMDCHSSHLDLETLRHLRRLGFLTVIIPAKLTWLLQPLDVYVYSDLKRSLRVLLHQQCVDHPDLSSTAGSWISPTARAVKSVLVSGDWGEHFDKLGAGICYGPVRSELSRYVTPSLIYPALPTLIELASLLNRVPGTAVTHGIHSELMQPAMRVRNLDSSAQPPRGAVRDLHPMPPATKRPSTSERPVGAFDSVMRDFLWRQQNVDPIGGIVGPPAAQVFCRAGAVP
jgi:hypothetical protein